MIIYLLKVGQLFGLQKVELESSITKTITARFPKHLNNFDVEDTNKYKVLYNNKLYKIASMSNIREENKYIQINIGGWE